MKGAQKPGHVSLMMLISHLREGRYVIPDFQREFEWKPSDIRELMRSIFLDYYIGSLLLWKGETENFDALACERLYGFPDAGAPSHIVLDGQQRLTAMYYAFFAPDVPAPRKKNRFIFFIRVDKFMAEAYDEAFDDDWTRRGEKLLEDRSEQFQSHMFPLAVVGERRYALPNWLQHYEQHWAANKAAAEQAGKEDAASVAHRNVENARGFGEHVMNIIDQYQIAYIELDRDLGLDKVCDIFTRINSRGIRLDVFDLINALLKPKGLQLKHMWREAMSELDFVETDRMNVYILQVMSLLRQAYCSPKYLYYMLPGQERKVRGIDGSLRTEILVPNVADFEERWGRAVAALRDAINLLRDPREYGAISPKYLPYVSILPAFASLQADARELPTNQQLGAQRKIRHWYWASVFTNRYSVAAESTTARDYLDLKRWFEDDVAEPALIAEFTRRFRDLELRRETNRSTSVYKGILNLLVLRGARDWMTGTVPQYGDLDDHHIVPKGWGKDHGLGRAVDTILNRTPLSADTNHRGIKDRLPNECLPELVAKNGEASVRATLETHLISPDAFAILLRDPFTPEDFEAFLLNRQRTIQDAIEDLLVKERLDLAPQIRAMDSQLEKIELSIRRIIEEALAGDAGNLPPHVTQKIDERIQTAAKRNPALDLERYGALGGKLEYADLRELQATITNKLLWDKFQERFGSKEILAQRFDSLAELRNSIRHIRGVDDVTRKEGEAAIIFFERVLQHDRRHQL